MLDAAWEGEMVPEHRLSSSLAHWHLLSAHLSHLVISVLQLWLESMVELNVISGPVPCPSACQKRCMSFFFFTSSSLICGPVPFGCCTLLSRVEKAPSQFLLLWIALLSVPCPWQQVFQLQDVEPYWKPIPHWSYIQTCFWAVVMVVITLKQ